MRCGRCNKNIKKNNGIEVGGKFYCLDCFQEVGNAQINNKGGK